MMETLANLRDSLIRQETYEMFERMLIQQEPFVPTYQPQRSSQSSALLHHFSNPYSS